MIAVPQAVDEPGSQQDARHGGDGGQGEHDELGGVLLLCLLRQGLQFAFLRDRREGPVSVRRPESSNHPLQMHPSLDSSAQHSRQAVGITTAGGLPNSTPQTTEEGFQTAPYRMQCFPGESQRHHASFPNVGHL